MLRILLTSLTISTLAAGCGGSSGFFGHSSSSPAAPSPAAPSLLPAAPSASDTGGALTAATADDLPEGNSYLANLSQLISTTQLAAYHSAGQHGQNLTIAVLDNGFSGLTNSVGVRLPPDTQLLAAPLDQVVDTTHGLKLAEIVYAMASGQTSYSAQVPGPKMVLLNTDGYTNLQAAVKQVIAMKADIVLYAQVWQYGGNFDGAGFINATINQATQAGILWLNAAGNLGQSTFNSSVSIQSDLVTVSLPYEGKYERFTVPVDQTPVTIALNWNDYENTVTYATSQDLDLILEDSDHHELDSGRLHQTGPNGTKTDPQYSAYPRELITTTLNAGTYYLRVEANTHNFTASSQLRLSIDGDGVQVLDGTAANFANSVGIPADNQSVITVGASDVAYSGQMPAVGAGKTKPEVQVPSFVNFSDGEHHYGTSSATAIVAGALAVFEGAYGKVSRAQFLTLLGNGSLASTATMTTATPTFQLISPTTLQK